MGSLWAALEGPLTFLVFGGVTFLMILFSLATLAISNLIERSQNKRIENEIDDHKSE